MTEFGSGACKPRRPGLQSDVRGGQEGWGVRKAIEFMEGRRRPGRPILRSSQPAEAASMLHAGAAVLDLVRRIRAHPPAQCGLRYEGQSPASTQRGPTLAHAGVAVVRARTFAAGRLRKLHGYLGSVSHVDHSAGELLEWLDRSGAAERTIVIYSSDHGDYACEHGIMEKAPGHLLRRDHPHPMIWRWPGRFKAGHLAREIVEAVDLPNTLCALTGVETMETADGEDISRLLRGESGSAHRLGVTEFSWSKSVRKDKHRLVFYPREIFAQDYPDGFGELYDLEADPWEMRNLFFDPRYAGVVREMQGDLLDWLIHDHAPRYDSSGGEPSHLTSDSPLRERRQCRRQDPSEPHSRGALQELHLNMLKNVVATFLL